MRAGPLHEAVRLGIGVERGHALDREFLVGEILAVLERHVEELALDGQQPQVVAPGERLARALPRVRVLREGARVAPEEVAGELVEHDHEGEHRLRRGAPGLAIRFPGRRRAR